MVVMPRRPKPDARAPVPISELEMILAIMALDAFRRGWLEPSEANSRRIRCGTSSDREPSFHFRGTCSQRPGNKAGALT